MAFTDKVASLDTICLDAFGIDATLFPQSGGEVPVTGILTQPTMLEDILPGRGGSVAHFFMRVSEIQPTPQHGDTISIDQDVYDVFEIEADNGGGGILKLRKKAQ